MKYFFGLIAFLVVMNSFKPQQQGGWERLGTRTVSLVKDHDEIIVTATEGAFTAIKISVARAPLHISSCKIVFGNGEEKEIEVKKDFYKGENSHVIDLPGEKRIIQKIIFNYSSTSPVSGKAAITVFGKH